MYSGATSARYSGAVKEAMPIASPSTTLPAIKDSGDQAKPQRSEPATNSTAPSISERLRPRCPDSHPAPTAPSAAPSIMALTIHSMTWSEISKAFWMNCVAPEITPMSSPNMSPARAASTQTKIAVPRACSTVVAAASFNGLLPTRLPLVDEGRHSLECRLVHHIAPDGFGRRLVNGLDRQTAGERFSWFQDIVWPTAVSAISGRLRSSG